MHEGKPRDKAAWITLLKQTFRFTGAEITNEFLMASADCPARIAKAVLCTRAHRKT